MAESHVSGRSGASVDSHPGDKLHLAPLVLLLLDLGDIVPRGPGLVLGLSGSDEAVHWPHPWERHWPPSVPAACTWPVPRHFSHQPGLLPEEEPKCAGNGPRCRHRSRGAHVCARGSYMCMHGGHTCACKGLYMCVQGPYMYTQGLVHVCARVHTCASTGHTRARKGPYMYSKGSYMCAHGSYMCMQGHLDVCALGHLTCCTRGRPAGACRGVLHVRLAPRPPA